MQNYSFLPLHGGNAPKWLFGRMVKLSSLIANEIIDEYGADEFVKRVADPYWFQALACAVGYDWHSSGTTTVTMAALKQALDGYSDIYIAGGKGKTGLKTPDDILKGADLLSTNNAEQLVKYSRITAKIDSSLIYDNFGIYHHTFVFSKDKWSVVQQGMFNKGNTAVRFQIFCDNIDKNDISCETNSAVASDLSNNTVDLTFKDNSEIKAKSLDMVNDNLNEIVNFGKTYNLPGRHEIIPSCDLSKQAIKLLEYANDMKPENYNDLLSIKGIGRKTLKSVALISSLIYKNEIYERDPVLYSYNLGGKDGIPYRINLKDYDNVISSMKEIIDNAKIGPQDRGKVLSRLSKDLEEKYLRLNKFVG
ncbi:DUF763 domain-containing protein [Candidatus Mancarchaeum acidiphilum]|nr:DUF763 domain-containing protein [Candidatus Mancarchaeum acidiphilum]